MLALPTMFHPPQVRFPWRLPNATVLALIVDLVGPLHQVRVEVPKRPDGLFLGVNSFGEQASLLGRLGGRLKQAFNHRAVAWFGGARFPRAVVARQQRVKIDTVEFSSSIDHQDL